MFLRVTVFCRAMLSAYCFQPHEKMKRRKIYLQDIGKLKEETYENSSYQSESG